MKTLILVRKRDRYFWKQLVSNKEIVINETYSCEFSHKLLSKLRKKPENNYRYFGFLNKWIFSINKYDKIIILDSAYTKQMDRVLKKARGEICFFYWNKLHENPEVARIHLDSIFKGVKKYSYNRYDCERYNLCFNSTMYYPIKIEVADSIDKIDFIFVGQVFGKRMRELDLFLDKVNRLGLTYEIYAVKSNKLGDSEKKLMNYTMIEKEIPYEKYLECVQHAKVILDIDKWEDTGCSLRAMESIFYQKKLITTNRRVIEERFYDKQNIFILGVDEMEGLVKFVNTPYKKLASDIVEYYSIEQWIERF